MIYKLVDSSSFFKDEDKIARIIIPGRADEAGLTKSAAHSDIENFVDSMLESKEGKMYLHINALGAGEYYGANKNGDYFPEAQLIQYHKTFEEHGYVYRHHINKDPAKSIGRVLFAVYNYDMHRVELIVEVDKALGSDLISRIESGDYPFTSMACKTPFDVCSICDNKAHTRNEYCEHLSGQLNRMFPNGKKVMALNLGPLKFFDISIVIRPADVTSSILRKVASEGVDEFIVGSADAAEAEGIDSSIEKKAMAIKQAALNKLADIVKEIDGGHVTAVASSAMEILRRTKDISMSRARAMLELGDINQVFNALAEAGISPSLGFLAELIHSSHGGIGTGVGKKVEELIPSLSIADIPPGSIDMLPEIYNDSPNPFLFKVVEEYRSESSLHPDAVEKRAYYWEQVVPTTAVEHPHQTQMVYHNGPAEYSTTDYILALAGAALFGKFVLSALSKQKNQLKLVYGNPREKRASVSPVGQRLLDEAALCELLKMKR